MNSFLVLTEDQDPNKTRNRRPTDRERQFLLQVIENEERKLSQLDAEIHSLNIEVVNTQHVAQEYESMLLIAYELFKSTEAALKAIKDVSQDFTSLNEQSRSWSPPESSPRTTYDDMLRDKFKLEKRHADGFLVAREDFARASSRVYELESELDASRSMLAFTQRSVAFLMELKARTQAELLPKRDLIGARRRIPAELWAQIFRVRVEGDEREFELAGREGAPPFTALRVSWVCKFWRAIARNQPTLWQYIAIPRAVEISSSQWERVELYLSLVKACLPIVHVAPECRGEPGSSLRTSQLLQQFERFKKLELRVSRRSSEAEDLLVATEPNVEELVLIGTYKPGAPGTSCPLKYGALANTQRIICVHLQPFMRNSSPHVEVLHLTTAKFVQHIMDPRSILRFLEALPSIEELQIDLLSPYSADVELARVSVTLPGIKRVGASLDVLSALFTQEVMLPNLEHVTIHSHSGEEKHNFEALWTIFLSIHSRYRSIQGLNLGTLFLPSTNVEVPETYARMIQQLSHLHFLHLTDAAAPYALEGMTLTKSIPALLQTLRLSSEAVKEDHVANFLRCFHTSRSAALGLLFLDCPKLSDSSRTRLMKLNAL